MPATQEGREERRTPYAAIAFVVLLLMAAEGVALYVILGRPAPIAMVKPERADGASVERSSAELMAPTVRLPEPVVVSVQEQQGGATELRTAVLSVAIRIGKAEGREDEVLDVADLEKTYVPKVKALLPWVRDRLIAAASGKTVQDLNTPETRATILRKLQEDMNKELESHGEQKRVTEILWDDFHFD